MRIGVWGLLIVVGMTGCGDDDGGMTVDGGMCLRHADCDDGVFCNGTELCQPEDPGADPVGCLIGAIPCSVDEMCDETADRCAQDCGFAPDGDGDGRPAIGCGGDDCDDTDPNRYPGNPEVCDEDGHDEDCDPRTFGERDRDGDGAVDMACCNVDPEGGPSFCGEDCNDNRRDARPGLPEVCDALDNDCDGTFDEGVVVEGYVDADRDLHGDPAMPTSSCAGLPGFSPVGDDCDDDNPARHGAQVEVCDEVDNDCDGIVDESPASATWYRDADDDGFGSAESGITISCVPPVGHVLRLGDCDDTNRAINPLAMERCNGIDDDCSGRADYVIDGVDREDDDGDGFADATCGGDDCDDANPDANGDAPEIMDLVDNDCDGTIDEAPGTVPWWVDRDGDGYGDDSEMTIEAIEPPEGRAARGGDCNDSDATIHPGVPDGCDGIDADCDEVIDENAARIAFYADTDGDGWGAGTDFVLACRPPAGTADRPLDCDDSDENQFPGAAERCNGEDTDCDGTVDEASERPWYADMDDDGFGNPDAPLMGCAPPSGYVANGDDCDDTNGNVSPGGLEECNGIDEDCDSTIDEMTAAACEDVPGGMGSCVAAACTIVCDAGRGDCNGATIDGCETDTSTNPDHCGACFTDCSAGDTCGVAGVGCDEARIVQIVAGQGMTMARRVGGGLAVWGNGTTHGAHGGGNVIDQLQPAEGIAPSLVHVDAGWNGGIGVTADGRAYAWGNNGSGQCGSGIVGGVRPGGVFVSGLTDVVHAAMGSNHACAVVREDDMGTPVQRVYCWGSDAQGQLGPNGTASLTGTPILVPGIDDAQQVYCGNEQTCVLRTDAVLGTRVYCWGRGNGGELGDGRGVASRAPVQVISLPPDVVELAQGSGSRACVRTASNRAYCWGQWPGDGSGTSVAPVVVGGFDDVLEIQQGPSGHPDRFQTERGVGCVLRDAGGVREVWCWGSNQTGSLGPGVTGGQTAPVRIADDMGMPLTGVTQIAAGFHHACVVRDVAASWEVWCWGENVNGEGARATVASPAAPAAAVGLP